MRESRTIYLDSEFRNRLFSRAYKNCGESLRSLALALGYRGKVRNGYVRNMWLGRVPVSAVKIHQITRLAGISLTEVPSHIISKSDNLEIKDWAKAYKRFLEARATIVRNNESMTLLVNLGKRPSPSTA